MKQRTYYYLLLRPLSIVSDVYVNTLNVILCAINITSNILLLYFDVFQWSCSSAAAPYDRARGGTLPGTVARALPAGQGRPRDGDVGQHPGRQQGGLPEEVMAEHGRPRAPIRPRLGHALPLLGESKSCTTPPG